MNTQVIVLIAVAYVTYWTAAIAWLRRSSRKRAAASEEAIRQAAAFLAALHGED